ncbi:MAG: hypothetical protein WDN25_09965 [Acetobacteraceae bacterium]
MAALLLGLPALLPGGQAAAQDRPASEEIGSWILTCPADAKADPCRLRHRTWVMPPGSGTPGAALEVVHRAGRFVPVVALRGLPTATALAGLLTLQPTAGLRFDAAPRTALDCTLDTGAVVCAPLDAASASAAGELTVSRSVLVQVRLTLPGTPLPEQERSLELSRTADALARFRATAPESEAMPVVPGLDWRGFLDRLAHDAGWEHGLADLLAYAGTLVPMSRP